LSELKNKPLFFHALFHFIYY